ncbi:MAG: hypothetical protein Q4A82_02680 [Corynebacterium sp.]|nr:hypothetical protein [Corynebacterium sp.]
MSFFAFALAALPLLAVGMGLSYWLLLVAAVVAGFVSEVSGSLWGSALQTKVRSDEIGRVSSIDYTFSFGVIPVAYVAYGFLGQHGSQQVILIASAGVIVVASLCAAWKNWEK